MQVGRLRYMPIGAQHFREIREKDSMYVDKTQAIFAILSADHSKYFLSRPRRFGKSLLLDTIGHLYSGKGSADLFKGLWIDGKWDFEAMQRPLVKYDFTQITTDEGHLGASLLALLHRTSASFGIQLEGSELRELQNELVSKIHAMHGKLVILIDEYDKPITAHLEGDMELVRANRDLLREFFGSLKSLGDKIELLFITGIARFTKTSLFSDLNHLYDLSMDERAATLCGITQEELERDFKPYFPSLEKALDMDSPSILAKLKEWYNGYHFAEKAIGVYNPFSLVNFFAKQKFSSYWHQSGMPRMMRRYFAPGEFREFDSEEVSEELLQSFDVEALNIVSLMFQTGYLTISGYDAELETYTLAYPNQEVQKTFLAFYLGNQANMGEGEVGTLILNLKKVFYQKEYDELLPRLNALLEILTYDMFTKQNEMLYHSLLHIAFSLVGMHTESEVHTRGGRCDMMIKARGVVHVLEFKFDQSADAAMTQLKARGYAQKWLSQGLPVVGFGVNINKESKSVDGLAWEAL